MYKTNKLAMFCSNKDKLIPLNKANVVYLFTCPGCSKTYIGKTERNLITRLEEHVEGRESAINLHLNVCSSYHDTLSLTLKCINTLLLFLTLKYLTLKLTG